MGMLPLLGGMLVSFTQLSRNLAAQSSAATSSCARSPFCASADCLLQPIQSCGQRHLQLLSTDCYDTFSPVRGGCLPAFSRVDV